MTKLNVPDMSCGHCKATVEGAIQSLDPMAEISVDLQTRTVDIDTDADMATVLKALADKGFPASVAA